MKYVEKNMPFATSPNRFCLDVGCGDRIYWDTILAHKYHYQGIDLLPIENSVMQIDLDKSVDREKIKSKYSLILCVDVLEHLEHPSDVLSYLITLIEDQGKLIIHVPNRNQTHVMIEPEKNAGHIVEGFNPWDIKEFFEKNLKNSKIEYTFDWSEAIAWDLDYILRNNIDLNEPMRKLLNFDTEKFIPYGILAVGDK